VEAKKLAKHNTVTLDSSRNQETHRGFTRESSILMRHLAVIAENAIPFYGAEFFKFVVG
jgi:hypothetical protein